MSLSDYIGSMFLKLQVDGNRSKDEVFKAIDSLLSKVQKEKENRMKLGKCFSNSITFKYFITRGIHK